MFLTILSLFLALVVLGARVLGFGFQDFRFEVIYMVAGGIILFLTVLVHLLLLLPLQRMSKAVSSQAMALYAKDKLLRNNTIYLFAFVIVSLLLPSMSPIYTVDGPVFSWQNIIPFIWIITFGIALDFIRIYLMRPRNYLDPYELLHFLSVRSQHLALQGQAKAATESMQAISEMAFKGLESTSIALCTKAADEILNIIVNIMEAPKDPAQKDAVIPEETHYLFSFALQQLESIYYRSIHAKWGEVASHILADVAKAVVISARYSLDLSSMPLHIIGKMTHHATIEGLKEISIQASCTLLEVGKALAVDKEIAEKDITAPFLSIVAQLEKNAKDLFSKDKSTDIQILKQPFIELKDVLVKNRYATNPELNPLVRDLERILEEFTALEQILRTIPPKSV